MDITSRRAAVRAGNRRGMWSPAGIAASEASEGRGIDARAVPARWREVFERAFKRAACYRKVLRAEYERHYPRLVR